MLAWAAVCEDSTACPSPWKPPDPSPLPQGCPHEHLPDEQPPLPALPGPVILKVLQLLSPQDLALNGRFACKDAALSFTEDHDRTLCASRPLPPHAEPLLLAGMRSLPLERKLSTLAAAAASGSETNILMVWRSLEACLFPLLLRTGHYHRLFRGKLADPGAAAVRSGHAHLLPLLLERCRPAVRPQAVLAAAARRSPMAGHGGLLDIWRQLLEVDRNLIPDSQEVLTEALLAEDQEAGRRLRWLLHQGLEVGEEVGDELLLRRSVGSKVWDAVLESCRFDRAVVLIRAGCDTKRQTGCTAKKEVLWSALQYGTLEDVAWLLDERACGVGIRLPEEDDVPRWKTLVECAAEGSKAPVEKLEWLREQGPVSWGPDGCGRAAAQGAARAGNAEVLEHMLATEQQAAEAVRDAGRVVPAAVASGSVATVELLLQVSECAHGVR